VNSLINIRSLNLGTAITLIGVVLVRLSGALITDYTNVPYTLSRRIDYRDTILTRTRLIISLTKILYISTIKPILAIN